MRGKSFQYCLYIRLGSFEKIRRPRPARRTIPGYVVFQFLDGPESKTFPSKSHFPVVLVRTPGETAEFVRKSCVSSISWGFRFSSSVSRRNCPLPMSTYLNSPRTSSSRVFSRYNCLYLTEPTLLAYQSK